MYWAARFVNNTGGTITSLDISYFGEQWRQGGCAPPTGQTVCTTLAQTLDFQYQVATAGVITDANTPTTNWLDHNPLDFTSPQPGPQTNAAIDGNAAANRTALSSTITVNVPNGQEIWLRWKDINHDNNDHGLAIDSLSVTANGTGGGTPTPTPSPTLSIDDVTQSEGNAGTTNFTFTVSLSSSTHGGVTFDIGTVDGTAQDGNNPGEDTDYTAKILGGQTIPNGADTYQFTVQVNGDTTVEPNETFAVNVVNVVGATTAPGGGQGVGTIVNDDAGICGAEPYTRIFEIQGSAATSPKTGETHVTEGLVIGDFQGSGNLSGFYIQDSAGDGNTATSDGIFVFDGGTPPIDVSVGDRVRVFGTVAEAFGNTRINPTLTTQICNSGTDTTPLRVVVDLPEPINNDLERYENMYVIFPETLTVTGNFTWGRFGELVLSSDGRRFQQNSFDRPNTPGALARANLNERNYIVLDDGKSVQNPDPIPYMDIPENTRRTGDTVAGLTGVLTFDFSEYRVQPTTAPTFVEANPRPATHAPVGGSLKVSSANVLNYFNGNGTGGGFPTARGADNAAEFARQRDKIIASLTTLDADVLGVIEIENDGGGAQSALQDLVSGMNAVAGAGTYVGLHGPNPGTDLIQNAIIYKPASVTPVGSQVNDINSAWDQARAPLAQTFQQNSNGEKFIFIVNHFTSKGCSANDSGADADQNDGQGCDNFQRTRQANRLLVFIRDRKMAAGDPDVLSMGDYNAYGEEDPNFIMEQDSGDTLLDGSGGLISLSERFVPAAERYSFQFDSLFGELDHAFATKSMNSQVTGTTIWHINSDEPVVIDYNQEFKKPGTTNGSPDLYEPTPYRSADHDPLVVGLSLTAAVAPAPGSLIISEFRHFGPASAQDEFIEIYNNTEAKHVVDAIDGSGGYSVATAADQTAGTPRCVIPNGTEIPARGHFLCVNSGGYSLATYPGGNARAATHDATYTVDIPNNAGLALFSTSNTANYSTDTRLDAVGSTSETNALYLETTGYPAISSIAREYSFFRDLRSGRPKDTGVNANDFIYVNTEGMDEGAGARLGAPGPENLDAPVQRNDKIKASLVDPLCNATVTSPDGTPSGAATSTCVRERNQTAGDPLTSSLGTLEIRRKFTNRTTSNVSRLRFRIVDITTMQPASASVADLRVITSADVMGIACADPSGNAHNCPNGTATTDLRGTTLEQPPNQNIGGGWNSSLSVGFINLSETLGPNGSVDVRFLMGVQQRGSFRFFINVEAEFEPELTPVSPASRGGAREVKP